MTQRNDIATSNGITWTTLDAKSYAITKATEMLNELLESGEWVPQAYSWKAYHKAKNGAGSSYPRQLQLDDARTGGAQYRIIIVVSGTKATWIRLESQRFSEAIEPTTLESL